MTASSAPLAELGAVATARAALDQRELDLIDRARRQGATWAQIAAALGMASRQAAEQRRHRLSAAAHRAAKTQDPQYGHSIVHLRTAIDDLHRWIAADAIWDARFVRAALVRQPWQPPSTPPPARSSPWPPRPPPIWPPPIWPPPIWPPPI